MQYLPRPISVLINAIFLIAFSAIPTWNFAQNSSQSIAQNPSQTRYLRFGIGLSEDHPQGMAVKKFAEIVSEKTQGRIKIELFAGGKLGNDVSMTDALRQGKLEMTAPDTSSLVRFTSGFGVINFPSCWPLSKMPMPCSIPNLAAICWRACRSMVWWA